MWCRDTDHMTIWITSRNRENWGVVRNTKYLASLTHPDQNRDTIFMYAQSETHAKEVFPSIILGEFKVTELFEGTTPISISFLPRWETRFFLTYSG